jgi:hemerythrin
MAIEWKEELATGEEEIDNQHKQLFARFDKLLTACNQGKGKTEVHNLLLFLGDYVMFHFATEENLQITHAYPGYQAHKEQHDNFIKDLQRLKSEFETEGATISLVIQTNQFMLNWLIKHISGTDKELGNYLTRAI